MGIVRGAVSAVNMALSPVANVAEVVVDKVNPVLPFVAAAAMILPGAAMPLVVAVGVPYSVLQIRDGLLKLEQNC